jgi:hypothetical protein
MSMLPQEGVGVKSLDPYSGLSWESGESSEERGEAAKVISGRALHVDDS